MAERVSLPRLAGASAGDDADGGCGEQECGRLWRAVHFTSYLTFVLASFHGTFAGTDATNLVYVAT